jgi:hypothetical protein
LKSLLDWFLSDAPDTSLTELWKNLPRLSADEISAQANLCRQATQRAEFRADNLKTLASNWKKSVFYQSDLKDMADHFHQAHLPLPMPLPQDTALMTRVHDAMFR